MAFGPEAVIAVSPGLIQLDDDFHVSPILLCVERVVSDKDTFYTAGSVTKGAGIDLALPTNS